MFSHQARLNARRIFVEDFISPTTGAAIRLAADLAMFAVLLGALLLMADAYLRLASGDLEDLHTRVEARRGW